MKMRRKKLKNQTYTESAKLTLSSPSLPESSKYGNGVAGYGVGGVAVSDGPNPMCSNVLRTQLQPIASQTIETQLIISFLSGSGREASELKSLYALAAQFV